MLPLWITIEPSPSEVRLILTEPGSGPALKARLPLPTQARAVPLLLESLSTWYNRPLHAVLDADAEDIRLHPERWVLLAGDLALQQVSVEWARRPQAARQKERSRFLQELGEFRGARQLLGFTATGLP
jgi:hypothetical protein